MHHPTQLELEFLATLLARGIEPQQAMAQICAARAGNMGFGECSDPQRVGERMHWKGFYDARDVAVMDRIHCDMLRWGTFGPTAKTAWIWRADDWTATTWVSSTHELARIEDPELPDGASRRAVDGSCDVDDRNVTTNPFTADVLIQRMNEAGCAFQICDRYDYLPATRWSAVHAGHSSIAPHYLFGEWASVSRVYCTSLSDPFGAEVARAAAKNNRNTYLANLYLHGERERGQSEIVRWLLEVAWGDPEHAAVSTREAFASLVSSFLHYAGERRRGPELTAGEKTAELVSAIAYAIQTRPQGP